MEASVIESQKDNVHSTADMTLSARQLYRHDPLLFLLKERLHLSNLWISVGAIFPPGIVYLLWWLLWGNQYPSGHNPGNISSMLMQTFIIFPFLFLVYNCIPDTIAKTFNTLYKNGVIGAYRQDPADKDAYARFKERLVFWMDNSWWMVAMITVIITYILYRIFLRELPEGYNVLSLEVRAVVVILYIPLMFATGISVIRLILALIFVNRLFYLFKLQIKLASPGSSGALGSLERLLWLCVSLMLLMAILFAALILARTVGGLTFSEVFLLAAIYILLIPALFIGWLIFPHRMMVKARGEMLQPLEIKYQQALMLALSTKAQDTQSVAAETLYLETLKKRYDLVYNSFSVWPLETSTLSSAGVTVLLPIFLPLILPYVISFILAALQRLGL